MSETPLRWYPTATVAAHSILLINPKYTNTYGKSFTPQSNKKKLLQINNLSEKTIKFYLFSLRLTTNKNVISYRACLVKFEFTYCNKECGISSSRSASRSSALYQVTVLITSCPLVDYLSSFLFNQGH